MKYLFVDTNNYLACAHLTKSNLSPKTLEQLKRLLEDNKLKLLVPEIVEIEFFRKVDRELERIKGIFTDFKKYIKAKDEPLLADEKQKINQSIDKTINQRRENTKTAKEYLRSLFTEQNVSVLRLTPYIFIRGYQRALGGRKPYKFEYCKECRELKHLVNSDCLIFELLLAEIRKRKISELIFCTGDLEDFAKYDKETKKHILHPELQSDFPSSIKVIFYENLAQALNEEYQTNIKRAESEKIRDYLKSTQFAASWADLAASLRSSYGAPLKEIQGSFGMMKEAQKAREILAQIYTPELRNQMENIRNALKHQGSGWYADFLRKTKQDFGDIFSQIDKARLLELAEKYEIQSNREEDKEEAKPEDTEKEPE